MIASAADQNAGWAVAPSPIPCFWPPHKKARELTIEEIETLIQNFGTAAKMLKAVGIDAVELHFMYYNFARPYKTLANPYPRTPAMAAGISSRIWTIEGIVKLVDLN